MNKISVAVFGVLLSFPGALEAQGYQAGLPCTDEPHSIQTHMADAENDLLACVGGTWASMLYGKSGLPHNKLATASASFSSNLGADNLVCSGMTDAQGNAYLHVYVTRPFVNDLDTGIVRVDNLLVTWGANGGACGATLDCSADPSGLSFTGNYNCFGASVIPATTGAWH